MLEDASANFIAENYIIILIVTDGTVWLEDDQPFLYLYWGLLLNMLSQ